MNTRRLPAGLINLTVVFTILVALIVTTAAISADDGAKTATQLPSIESPVAVAGRTQSEWAADLKSPNEFVRLRAAKTLGAFGPAAAPVLARALEDSSAGVRYWAASELGDLGMEAKPAGAEESKRAVALLEEMLQGKSAGLRISAAFALCRWGDLERGLPVLTEALKHPERGAANSAADFLARIGPPAKDALPALMEATKHNDYHIRGAAAEAVRRIQAAK